MSRTPPLGLSSGPAPAWPRSNSCCCSSARARRPAPARAARETKRFTDMEAARRHLHQQQQLPGIAGLLNWLSDQAFGAKKQDAGLTLAGLYRQLVQWSSSSSSDAQQQAAAAAVSAAPPHVVSALALLMLVSEHRVLSLAAKFPEVLDMQPSDVAQRLLLLKELLPECDVARLVELQPALLLGCPSSFLTDTMAPRLAALTAGLPGAPVTAMVMEDPHSMLFVDLQSGLEQLHELWPVDDAALAASDPAELVLALRALSDSGPPRRY